MTWDQFRVGRLVRGPFMQFSPLKSESKLAEKASFQFSACMELQSETGQLGEGDTAEPMDEGSDIDWNSEDDLEIESYNARNETTTPAPDEGSDIDWNSEDDLEIESYNARNETTTPAPDEESDIDWNSEDDLEIESYNARNETTTAAPSTSHSGNPRISQFLEMGFQLHTIVRALEEHGDDGPDDAILISILSYSAIEALGGPSTGHSHLSVNSQENPRVEQLGESTFSQDEESDMGWNTEDDLEIDSYVAGNETSNSAPVKKLNPAAEESITIASTSDSGNPRITQFLEMGFQFHTIVRALKEHGDDGPEDEIMVSILSYSAIEDLGGPSTGHSHSSENPQVEQDEESDIDWDTEDDLEIDSYVAGDEPSTSAPAIVDLTSSSRDCSFLDRKQKKKRTDNWDTRYLYGNDERSLLRKDMIGFGVPGVSRQLFSRCIPSIATGRPFFYYENVAQTPKGVWQKIKKCLYNIEPEFVDSGYFSAALRKRGYIHNLPLDGRYQLLPKPPGTIHEAFPDSVPYWPSWDRRQKLNCILTCIGSAQLTKRIKEALEKNCRGDADPPEYIQKKILVQCKKWNMIWVGKNTVSHLEPHEIEPLLGFPKDHTRGYSTTDRHRFLGNSFQIDTVAYHLSVLKGLYPGGIKVLSLFSGIGGAEVALYRLGIPLKVVVSVEISEQCREILRRWWVHTKQTGVLRHANDVREVDRQMLKGWISEFGNFDLVIGGSPCNNLAGINRSTRVGLDGEHSSMFYHYVRILNIVRLLHRDL